MQIVSSVPLPVNPSVTSMFPGQALSFVKVGDQITLAPYSNTNTDYAGFFVAQNGNQEISVDQLNKQAFYGIAGMFNVPAAGAIDVGAPIYVDPATGLYGATAPAAGYTKQVGVALTKATAANQYILAEMIKSY